MTEPKPRAASPREEGELEDGELSDDSVRPESPKPVRPRTNHRNAGYQHRPRPPRPPQHCYRPKEQYRPPPLPPQSGDGGQRPSFWDTLGRFRSRGWVGRGPGGRFCDRGLGDRGIKGGQRPGGSSGWPEPSPRKLKSYARSPPRKSAHLSRNENCEEESFEDLLLKYKQIKLELESISKDEKLALNVEEKNREPESAVHNTNETVNKEKSIVDGRVVVPPPEEEKPPVKAFQAFEIKPLKQKLKILLERDKVNILKGDSKTQNVPKNEQKQNTPQADKKKGTSQADQKKQSGAPQADQKKPADQKSGGAPEADQKKPRGAPHADQKKPRGAPHADQKKPRGAPHADQKKPRGAPHADQKKPGGAPQADQKQQGGAPQADQKQQGGAPQADQKQQGGAPQADQKQQGGAPQADQKQQGGAPQADQKQQGGAPQADQKEQGGAPQADQKEQGGAPQADQKEQGGAPQADQKEQGGAPQADQKEQGGAPQADQKEQGGEETTNEMPKLATVNTEQGDSCDSIATDEASKKPAEEEEELSELHLRLLALQSASKKWQQKEHLVMKESKEKLTRLKADTPKDNTANSHLPRKANCPTYAAKQALRRQQTKAWKRLQQQKAEEKHKEEEERKNQADEEERRKREEEIRKIRDLSNQEEQYNRFMKLVGDKSKRSKSSDIDPRRSDKAYVESAGGIYQYDNYEEVAMDTDSETNSPGASPSRVSFPSDGIPSSLCVTEQFPSALCHPQPALSYYEDVSSGSSPETPLPPPPLPPGEPEQPPKPPFADEEEEEEMLLREELLKSLATKRVCQPEEATNSLPPSPPALSNVMPVTRITLRSSSINNTVQRRQTTPITRVLRPIRRVIKVQRRNKITPDVPSTSHFVQLPKHKSVVVTLNASDDSESDGESSSPILNVFGGLESMIKEARRTAEASKPKAPSKSEKENDPMRTPESLPDDKKIEYRLLKEEIASREKHKRIKTDQSKANASIASSDTEVEASRSAVINSKITEAEAKHKKQTLLLMKDETVLKHLLEQEAKKKESIKTAELKIARLTEQMQATEKFLNANRLFLKKLQEQITKVQHRVKEKTTLALKYSEELARAKALASQELGKRKLEQNNIGGNKMFRSDPSQVASPKKQTAEAIAKEKKRLQQLEQEYALKIQKLKELQARSVKEQAVRTPPVVDEPEFVLPQPSLHDLSQDKLTLDTEENDTEDEVLSTSVKQRRRSFRDSNAVTKPNLKHSEPTPTKEGSNKISKTSTEGPELFLGLNIEQLKSLHSGSDNLKDLLSQGTGLMLSQDKIISGKEIPVDVDLVPAQIKQTEIRPTPFGPYRSPLLVFKSYRFSPYYRTKEKLLLSSVSYSNMIEPQTSFCHFDLTGTCNADDCQWQHMRDCTLSRHQLFQDILSYNLDLIGCSEKSTEDEISTATEKYVDKLFGVNLDRMSMDQMSVLLVSYVNESRTQTPPHTTWKEKRKWRPVYWKRPISDNSASDDEETSKVFSYAHPPKPKIKVLVQDAVITPEDVRYFTSETDDLANLEASVLENPQVAQLWIKLAYKYMTQSECTSSECLDSALNVLSRALEHNRENSEIWCHYLKLFSRRGTKEECQEMYETAAEYASSYDVWWAFLAWENSFDEKDLVCSRVLQYLMVRLTQDPTSDLLSLQLLETLLYRVHLSLFTGRLQNALALLQNALKSPNEKSIGDHLNAPDRCLAWLSYIHLMEFSCLPANFYDPTNSNPSRMVNKEPFLLPWPNSQSIQTEPVMLLAVFEAAVSSCSQETMSIEERTEVCLPLYKNMVTLHLLTNQHTAAVDLSNELLESSAGNWEILEMLCSVYSKMGQPERGIDLWLSAFRNSPGNAQIFYYGCKFLVEQGHSGLIPPLMQKFARSFFTVINVDLNHTELLSLLVNYSNCVNSQSNVSDISAMQKPYIWLVFCLWQSLLPDNSGALNAYEAALGAVMQQDALERLWMDYLIFTNRKIVLSKNKAQDSKHFTDLVNRCLMTVPTRFPTPYSTADYWTNYEFHNKVIYFYLSCVPKVQHSKILERLFSTMPTNLGLALRVLKQEMEESSIQIVKMQSKMFTYNFPKCLPIWKIAIAVESFIKGQKEVRQLYHRALQPLHLCAALWKDQLLFEASEGGKTDNLRKLVSKCQEVGVSLDELLNLNTESLNL
uniref:Zinc finger C3H1-type containing n=1 Tax=Leptobrachium leishanense TaxID=445787 RepID=A0A8C5M028_9ANUR